MYLKNGHETIWMPRSHFTNGFNMQSNQFRLRWMFAFSLGALFACSMACVETGAADNQMQARSSASFATQASTIPAAVLIAEAPPKKSAAHSGKKHPDAHKPAAAATAYKELDS